MKWLARIILIAIIPVFIWVIFSYLGGVISAADLIKRTIALVLAAVVMYFIASSRN